MKRAMRMCAAVLLAVVGMAGVLTGDGRNSQAGAARTADAPERGNVLKTRSLAIDVSPYKVVFLDLGSDRCVPCRQMQPIMKEIAAVFLGGLATAANPCVLAVLVAYVAEKGNVPYGGLLLFVYALGHSLLILVAGTSMGAAKRMLESRGLRAAAAVLRKAAGVVIILVGANFVV